MNYDLKCYILNYIEKENYDIIRKCDNLIYESRYIEIKTILDFMEIINNKNELNNSIVRKFERLEKYKDYDLKEIEIIENYKTLKIGITLKYK